MSLFSQTVNELCHQGETVIARWNVICEPKMIWWKWYDTSKNINSVPKLILSKNIQWTFAFRTSRAWQEQDGGHGSSSQGGQILIKRLASVHSQLLWIKALCWAWPFGVGLYSLSDRLCSGLGSLAAGTSKARLERNSVLLDLCRPGLAICLPAPLHFRMEDTMRALVRTLELNRTKISLGFKTVLRTKGTGG